MNYIYDVVLNFFDLDNFFEFYEWDKNDNFIYIEKIPIFIINSMQMDEIINCRIKVDKEFLNSIYNKTFIENDNIPYCVLVTDLLKVVGLKFDSEGVLIEKSSLLLDEEDAVIEEVSDYDTYILEYEIVSKIDRKSTRLNSSH